MIDILEVDLSTIENTVLRRLVEEVRYEQNHGGIDAYNRTHNRHNRSKTGIGVPPYKPKTESL